ncbi:MAG TPA: hypothetical protein VGT03_10060 [Candidatus Acidoferrales bacterium]|nr:hypothetical protein [Candidatus Acidoferrales bacterium]
MKRIASLLAITWLFCTGAFAGNSHKVFKYPPSQVFAAGVRVAQRGVGATMDEKAQTFSFSTGTSGAYLGVNKLELSLLGMPAGCGETNPCTATNVEVKCTRVTPDTMGFRLCSGDVGNFYRRLGKELKKPSSAPVNKPASPDPSM